MDKDANFVEKNILYSAMQTDRLIIRPFTLDDAEEYFPLVSDPTILRFTGEGPVKTIEDARQILKTRPLSDYSEYGYGRMACIENSSGRLVGFSGLKYLSELREVDIGYRFLPDAWGKGYATESAKIIMDEMVPAFKLNRVIGLAFSENYPSVKVLQKLGLKFEKNIKLVGVSKELELHSITF